MHPLLSRFIPLTILAFAGLAAGIWTTYATVKPKPVPPIASVPQQGPWKERISASGLIEADSSDTVVGVPEAALIKAVLVRVGQQVDVGDVLISLDDRMVRADFSIAAAEYSVARAELAAAASEVARLESLPRAEDAAPIAAQVAVAEAELVLTSTQRKRLEVLGEKGVESQLIDARHAEAIAMARVAQIKASLSHAQLPAWDRDIAVARSRHEIAAAQVIAAQARVEGVRTRLTRLDIRSPRAATVMAAEAMVGNLAAPGDRNLIVLADLSRLFVRVEVDESQVCRLKPGLPGRAWLRGDHTTLIELRYERIEPQAAARRAIKGKPGERLDGRAVQVLYQLLNPPEYLRPGLLMDVDLQCDPSLTVAAGQR